MIDAVLSPADREEALSRAYVAAVAAGAGYATFEQDFDRDGVDVQIRAGEPMRPSLDIQLKATINLGEPTNGEYRYPLKLRNYDLLRKVTMVPRVLVILSLPKKEVDWLSVSVEELIIRRCAFWANLAGSPESKNADKVTVSVLENDRFDVVNLKSLMEKARAGRIA